MTPATAAALRVSLWPGVGAAALRELLRAARGAAPDEVEERALERWASLGEGRREAVARAAGEVDRAAAAAAEAAERLGLTVFSLLDPAYPSRLRGIADPPPLLYLRGDASALAVTCVAVVGTREASEAGLRAAGLVAREAAARGACVVSGLARGVDAAAHRAALAAGGRTAAVLAHGLDRVYPREHVALAEEVAASGGALVSEHAPGVALQRWMLPARNRLITGLSAAAVLVESRAAGGSMIAARHALAQGCRLYAVLPPGDAAGLQTEGAAQLVARGDADRLRGTADLRGALAVADLQREGSR